MSTSIEIETKLNALKPFLQKEFSVKRLGYFGSYATNNQTENSDLDIVIELEKPIGWKFFTIESYLEKELKVKVDLTTLNGIKEQLKESIFGTVKFI